VHFTASGRSTSAVIRLRAGGLRHGSEAAQADRQCSSSAHVEEIDHRPAHAERAARTVEIFRTGAARLTATPRTTARN